MRRRKTTSRAIYVVLLILGLIGLSIILTFRNTISEVIVTPRPQAVQTSPTPTPDPLAPYGVLLLGLRGDTSLGAYLTDTMMLGVVRPRDKKVTLISIPRDLWVPVPVATDKTEHFKINAAYAIGLDDRKYPNKAEQFKGAAGGGTLAKSIVEGIFGIPVRYFVSVDFDGFKKSIDILGGVDVTVTKSFEDKFYPMTGKENDTCGKTDDEIASISATMSGDLLDQQFTCRYEDLIFTKGTIHMDGETALKFARSRHAAEDGSDFARSNRQKQVMLAVKNKVLQVGFLPRAIPFIQSLAGDVRTDVPLEAMTSYLAQASELSTYEITSVSLSTDNALLETYSADRQYILIPKSGTDNWQSIQDFVNAQINPKPITPSATPKN